MLRYRGWLAAAIAATATGAFLAPVGAHGATGLVVGVPTVVDPVRSAPEPTIAIDNTGNPWITGPGGTSTQTSWFFHSTDGGLTYPLQGPANGHWLCGQQYGDTGGGDSFALLDKATGNVYLTDQQALASVGTGVVKHGVLTSKCFSTPGMSADRPFQGLLHPAGSSSAPQWSADGHKPIVYMSWNCLACGGGLSNAPGGGLAFAWTDDGVNWHAADAGVPTDNLVADQFFESGYTTGFNFDWHGPTVVDQQTGYVYTALSCADSTCPTGGPTGGSAPPEYGIVIGKPGPLSQHADSSNVGQFVSESYQTAVNKIDGKPLPKDSALFPDLAMDKAGTLYLAWIQADSNATTAVPNPVAWHLYYSYSKDRPNHKVWSKPIRVDSGPQSATAVMGWVAAGDAGKIAFDWLGTTTREHPSNLNESVQWFPFMSVATDADTSTPHFYQSRVGANPNHVGDICLQGTTCGATTPPGNRDLADFISIDITPDGAAQGTWGDDSNQVKTDPTSLEAGVPITMTAREISGPRLIGSGDVSDSRWSPTPTTSISDRTGDVIDNPAAQLDLTGVKMALSGSDLVIHVPVASLGSLASPSSTQPNVWWMVTWKYKHRTYFAKAESDSSGTPTFVAGIPQSYDRPGLTYYTVPTLLDYRSGTTVSGARVGNEFVIHVPTSVVGGPKAGQMLEAVTGYTVLDNGAPPFVTSNAGNVPLITDATPAFNYTVGMSATRPQAKNSVQAPQQQHSSLPRTGDDAMNRLLYGLAALTIVGTIAVVRRRFS